MHNMAPASPPAPDANDANGVEPSEPDTVLVHVHTTLHDPANVICHAVCHQGCMPFHLAVDMHVHFCVMMGIRDNFLFLLLLLQSKTNVSSRVYCHATCVSQPQHSVFWVLFFYSHPFHLQIVRTWAQEISTIGLSWTESQLSMT